MTERFLVNFEKTLGLDHTIGGYVARITSPKGIKKEKNGKTSYSFHTESVGVPSEKGYSVISGIYEIIDICKWNRTQKLQWNIYLLVVDNDGATYPVAEYLDSPYTLWVRDAVKIVKSYFNEEELETIELTPQPKMPPRKTGFTNPPLSKDTSKRTKKEEAKEKTARPKKEEKAPKKPKKKPAGRPQEREELEYGYARMMTFTGMVIGVYKILRHNKKYIEVETQKGVVRFSKEDGKQVNAEKPRYANKIEWNLDKEVS